MERCPFCHACRNQVVALAYDQGFAVFCYGCAATGPQMETPEEAELAWTKRDNNSDDVMFEN